MGRVACETLITTGLVVVAGEITTATYVDIPRLVRERISDIGYTRAKFGFDADTCGVIVALDEQSPDIAQGVDASFEMQHGDEDPLDQVGAGDQGMMFGYASNETDELMPLPIMLAHRLAKRLAEVRKADVLPYLRPDGKTQVTVRYEDDEHGRRRPVEIERVLISTQHRDGLDIETLLKPDLVEHVLEPILPRISTTRSGSSDEDFFYCNPTGKFVIGGPMGDAGLTGRKIIVDTYGGAARTAAARSPARTRRRSTARPPTPRATSRRTSSPRGSPSAARSRSRTRSASRTRCRCSSRRSARRRSRSRGSRSSCASIFDLRPAAILRDLDLRRPIYAKTAAYGHFGRDDRDFTWERTDKADALRAAAGLAEPARLSLSTFSSPAARASSARTSPTSCSRAATACGRSMR